MPYVIIVYDADVVFASPGIRVARQAAALLHLQPHNVSKTMVYGLTMRLSQPAKMPLSVHFAGIIKIAKVVLRMGVRGAPMRSFACQNPV